MPLETELEVPRAEDRLDDERLAREFEEWIPEPPEREAPEEDPLARAGVAVLP